MKLMLLFFMLGVILLMAHFDAPARFRLNRRVSPIKLPRGQTRANSRLLEHFQTSCVRSQLQPKSAPRARQAAA